MKIRLLIVLIPLFLCVMLYQNNISLKNINNTIDNNTVGNIKNGGYILRYGDVYLYTNFNDNDALYKMDMSYKQSEIISDTKFHYQMNISNNTLYYLDSLPGNIRSIELNNKKNHLLIKGLADTLIVYNDKIFYRLTLGDMKPAHLYSADLYGNKQKLLAKNVGDYCVVNNKIYFCNLDNESLYEMKIDGSEKRYLNDSYACNIIYDSSNLYYYDIKHDCNMVSLDFEEFLETTISSDYCTDINLFDNWLYYRNQSDKGNLYRVKIDGSIKEKIVTGNITDINIIDGKVYFRRVTENIGWYIYDIDSGFEQDWESVLCSG